MADIQYLGTGRRKTSVARVRLVPGNGNFIVNKKPIDEYFNYETLRVIAREPLTLTENLDSYDVYVNVKGGGSLVKQEQFVMEFQEHFLRLMKN